MPDADLILKNARVVTVDPARPAAEVVAVRGDKISLVADNGSAESVRGRKTKIIDCQGRTVAPGFNDAHCHIFSLLRKQLSIDLSPASVNSIGDIKAAIRRKVENTPVGEWITGSDYNEFYLAEKRHPNRWDLDQAAPDHPVVISHSSLHGCVLNSMALSLAGITSQTEEPPGGRIDRDIEGGQPSGLLFEMLGYIRSQVMSPMSEAELDGSLRLADKHYLSQGITSLQDATVTNDIGRWRQFSRFKETGRLKSRLSLMSGMESLGQFREAGLVPRSGDTNLRLGGAKVILTEAPGRLFPSQEELNRQVFEAHRAGWQVAIHAVQPNTVEAAVLALENAQKQLPRAGRRHRIEHCSECPPELLERLSKLEAVIVTQPPFLYYSGERYLATLPPERLQWLYRINSFLGGGLVTAASSDSPIVPDNPLFGIYAAVTRLTGSGQPILPEEGISAAQGLAMYTINAAYASFEEDIKGSITPGKLADMVVLSDDPTRVPPEQIKDIKVEMTIIGGQVVWEG